MNETLLSHQVGLAAAAVYFIELLKRTPVPWFTEHSGLLNRVASLLIAAATAIGLTLNLHGSLVAGGALTITFPSLAAMLQTGIHFLAQVGMQEGLYQTTVKKAPT